MHVAAVGHGRDFDAGHELDAGRRARRAGGGEAAGRVVVGDAQHGHARFHGAPDELCRRRASVGRSRVGVEIDQRVRAEASRRLAGGRSKRFAVRAANAACREPLAQGAVLADQQIEMNFFLVGKFQEDLLAFRVLEPFAVALEELVRPPLALDPDEQRLLIVDAAAKRFGAFGEDAVRGALEEQKRRSRFEHRILRQQLSVALLERPEMLALFGGKLLEHRAAAGVARERGGAGIELETAPLGRNRHAQRVAREDQRRRHAVDGRRLFARAALFAGPGDLHHRLRRFEVPRRRDFLDERLDVGAQKLGRPVADVADEMEMARVAVGRLEARPAFAKIHLARNAGADHPLERAVDGGPADARIFLANQIAEIVGAEVAFLADKEAEDAIAFAGAFAARGAQALDIWEKAIHHIG